MKMQKFIKNELSGWKKFEVIWLLLACAVILGLSIYWKDSVMGILSSTTGVVCVVCTGKGKLSAYLFGLVNSVLYALIAFKATLYGETSYGKGTVQVSMPLDDHSSLKITTQVWKTPDGNWINEVGVTEVYGVDDPCALEEGTGLSYVKEHNMTPDELVDELTGFEKAIYKKVFAGSFSKKMHRMYEYKG